MSELRSVADPIVQAFRKHDSAGTKVIDRRAFICVIRELQPALSEHELESLLSTSGQPEGTDVRYEDFITWLCGSQEPEQAEQPAPAPPVPEYVQEFFEYLFGFNEKSLSYDEVRERFAAEDDGPSITLLSKANGRRFRAGSFECPSLRSLREEEKRLAGAGLGGALEVRHVVTTGALEDHANPANAGALFQVASQFNCLEFTSSARIPEEGVSWYVHDATQGPACAVACAPATVYRNYLVPLGAERGQTAERQLNLLEDLEALLGNREELDAEGHGRYFWLKNGYVCSDTKRLEALRKRLEEMDEAGREELRSCIKVGLGLGSEVSFSALVPFEGLVPVPAGSAQRASQVFSAAANVKMAGCVPADWEPFTRLLLEATYEAALWAAVRNARLAAEAASPPPLGSRRVMLTSVGGGVFGNRPQWIMDAMNRALRVLAAEAPESGWGLEVCVAHFESLNPTLAEEVCLGKQ